MYVTYKLLLIVIDGDINVFLSPPPPPPVSEDVTLYPESQSRQFLTFLTRANRYPTLALEGVVSNTTTRKVVLIEVRSLFDNEYNTIIY